MTDFRYEIVVHAPLGTSAEEVASYVDAIIECRDDDDGPLRFATTGRAEPLERPERLAGRGRRVLRLLRR